MNTFTKKRINLAHVTNLKRTLRAESLNTVCESARCPNIGECFARRTATFLILGNACTRTCRFCAVEKSAPVPPDPGEPERVARLVRRLDLGYVVVTSVTRDDLPDGGANYFAETVRRVRRLSPRARIEILIPDFNGDSASLREALASGPDIVSHNIETVPRLYGAARSGADYRRSLGILRSAREAGFVTKSGLMLGLGETAGEVHEVMGDLRKVSCDILTLGQYLAPTKAHYPVKAYLADGEFADYRSRALWLGFAHCESGTFVRSSYRAYHHTPRPHGA